MEEGSFKDCPRCGSRIHIYASRCGTCRAALPARTEETRAERVLRLGGMVLTGASLVVLEWVALREARGLEWWGVSKIALPLLAWLAGFVLLASVPAWLAWTALGRRRAYGLLVFSVLFSAMALGYALYLYTEDEAFARHSEGLDELWLARRNQLGLVMARDGGIRAPSPERVYALDKVSRPLIDFLNTWSYLASRLDEEVAKLDKANLFSGFVATNQQALRLELGKRKKVIELLDLHQREFAFHLRAARRQTGQTEVIPRLRRVVESDLDLWISRKGTAFDGMITRWRRVEQSEADFLDHLIANEGRFRPAGQSLVFEDPRAERELLELRNVVYRATEDAGTLARTSSGTVGRATRLLRDLVE